MHPTPNTQHPTPLPGFHVTDGQSIVCLGDSITEAAGGYVSVMAHLIAAVYPERRIRIRNAGIGGHKVTDMRARLERDVIAHDPDWVTINVGINDVWHGFFDFKRNRDLPEGGGPDGVSLDIYEKTLTDLVMTLLHRTHAKVLLVTPTVIGEDPNAPANRTLNDYVTAMERVGQESGVSVCPLHQAFVSALQRGKSADPSFSLTTDGVHMNPIGNNVIAVTILSSLGFFDDIKDLYPPSSPHDWERFAECRGRETAGGGP